MDAKSRKLAEALAARLSPVIPSSYRIEVNDGMMSLYRGGNLIGTVGATKIADESDGRPPAELIGTATRAALEAVQDFLVEDLRDQWPRSVAGDLALPHVQVEGQQVRVWFGDEQAPAVRLTSIELAELAAT